MSSWTSQSGYPLLTVDIDYSSGYMSITQVFVYYYYLFTFIIETNSTLALVTVKNSLQILNITKWVGTDDMFSLYVLFMIGKYKWVYA